MDSYNMKQSVAGPGNSIHIIICVQALSSYTLTRKLQVKTQNESE